MNIKFNRKRLITALKKSKVDALDMYRESVRVYHEGLDKARFFIDNEPLLLSG